MSRPNKSGKPSTEAAQRASMKYAKENVTQFKLSLNNNTDSDIIDKLNTCDNKQGYIKSLIRSDIEKR